MNRVILIGRLTRDPEVRYSDNGHTVARFAIAVDRRFKRENEQNSDFINTVAFGKTAEFVEKYFFQGNKIVVEGRIQTGSYTNQDGQKVYTTDVVAEQVEFGESKNSNNTNGPANESRPSPSSAIGDGFMNIPDGVEDEGLPFN
ncbi:single-stranded DNA-binding protein [Lacrimispora defluvii]|uniref:Single-stranded DNA-binding protein n=1 Tax=Lacrimispora defluvii TaxID=2719233 RepID=A0ABX1VV20_9FIRM|nr:single-stranded DNA-binding protein [Lacrimispora defluvii]NNJ31624.1 single-stranded DNA-binding protein [Lacrimispora defluvii]